MTHTVPSAAGSIVVSRATHGDLDALVPLFDAYRVFYRQPSDPDAARAFLDARLQHDESVVFIARGNGVPTGFTQLYPAFSSVAARRVWILNDLFVAPAARKRGVARALMDAARIFAASTGAVRITLETARDNRAAQALYESLGYGRDDGMFAYSLTLDGTPPPTASR